jgi:hypothetical protein
MRPTCTPIAAALLSLAVSSHAQTAPSDLDAVAKQAVTQNRVIGASVLVAHGDKILLHKGYGLSSSATPPASATTTTSATRSNPPTASPKPWTR